LKLQTYDIYLECKSNILPKVRAYKLYAPSLSRCKSYIAYQAQIYKLYASSLKHVH